MGTIYAQPRGDARLGMAGCSSCCAPTSPSSSSSARDKRLATGAALPEGKPARPRPSPAPSASDEAELEGIPAAFLRDSLLLLAPRLLAGADSIVPVLPPSSPALAANDLLPTSLDCLLEPPPSTLPAGYALLPTHLLAVTIPSPTCAGLAERVIVPVHSLPLSLAAPTLGAYLAACAATAASLRTFETDEGRTVEPVAPPTPPASPPSRSATDLPQPPTSSRPQPATSHLSLPVAPLSLPSLAGFTALHAFVYTRTLGNVPLDAEALVGVGACARALGVEGEVGRELEEALHEAWAGLGWTVEEGSEREDGADDEEWGSEEGEDWPASGCESACESE